MQKAIGSPCITNSIFPGYALVAYRKTDIFLIKNWRNEQMQYLRQKAPLTDEQQRLYYEEKVEPTYSQAQPAQILMSFLLGQDCIGYGGLTNISWPDNHAEVSFLLSTEHVKNLVLYKREFAIFLNLLQQLAFKQLSLNRLYTETYDIRPWHMEVIEQSGFLREGVMREHVLIDGAYVNSIIHGCLQKDWEKN